MTRFVLLATAASGARAHAWTCGEVRSAFRGASCCADITNTVDNLGHPRSCRDVKTAFCEASCPDDMTNTVNLEEDSAVGSGESENGSGESESGSGEVAPPTMIFEKPNHLSRRRSSFADLLEGPVVVNDVLYFTDFSCEAASGTEVCVNGSIWSYDLLTDTIRLFRSMNRTINGLAYREADHSLYGCIYERGSGGLMRIPLQSDDAGVEVLIDSAQTKRWNDLVFNKNQTILYVSQFDTQSGYLWKYELETRLATPLITSDPENDALTYPSKVSPGWYKYTTLQEQVVYLNANNEIGSVGLVFGNFTGGIASDSRSANLLFFSSINQYVVSRVPLNVTIQPVINVNADVLDIVDGQLSLLGTIPITANLIGAQASEQDPIFMTNGIALSKNGRYIYFRTAGTGNDHIHRYDIDNGVLNSTFSEELYNIDGMFVDDDDNLYAQRLDKSGIDIINPNGTVYRHISTPTVPFVTNIVRYQNDLLVTTLFGHVLRIPL